MNHCTQIAFKLCQFSVMCLLAGCVPAPLGKYYKPIYQGLSATYSGDQCGGKAGAPASLTLALADGVTLNINALRNYGEQDRKDRPLRITLMLPKGVQAQFLSDEIRVSPNAEDAGQSIRARLDIFASVIISTGDTIDMARIAPTAFPPQDSGAVVSDFSASTGLSFSLKDDFVPSSLSMELPSIIVLDGTPVQLPTVKLIATAKKRLETYPGQYKANTSLIYTTQESEQALASKYSRCTSETPSRKCDQILMYDEGRFNVDRAGFKFSGRWYVFNVEKHSPFIGDVDIRYEKPVKWIFSDSKIRITDLSSFAERIYQFEKFPLYFGYKVPLDTPVRGVNDSPYNKATSISINSSLGEEELPRYFIRLPPLLLNGKVYPLKPIELEKRLLDFGLEPFNC